MTLWSVASVLTLAFIFWLNAVMTASPYIVYLSGLKSSLNERIALLRCFYYWQAFCIFF